MEYDSTFLPRSPDTTKWWTKHNPLSNSSLSSKISERLQNKAWVRSDLVFLLLKMLDLRGTLSNQVEAYAVSKRPKTVAVLHRTRLPVFDLGRWGFNDSFWINLRIGEKEERKERIERKKERSRQTKKERAYHMESYFLGVFTSRCIPWGEEERCCLCLLYLRFDVH